MVFTFIYFLKNIPIITHKVIIVIILWLNQWSKDYNVHWHNDCGDIERQRLHKLFFSGGQSSVDSDLSLFHIREAKESLLVVTSAADAASHIINTKWVSVSGERKKAIRGKIS